MPSPGQPEAPPGSGRTPKISVLIDNYNYEKFVGGAIESVLQQTFRDFELIVVDDGSTDGSREIIARQTDPRIKPVFKENGGQASAFKAGIAAATGDYVAFLDSDDLWDSNKLERCVQILQANPDVVLLNHSFRKLDANGAVTEERHYFVQDGLYHLLPHERRLDVVLSNVPTSFFLGRRAECQQLQFDEKEWRVCADVPIVGGLAARGAIYNLPEVLGSYRVHGRNLWFGKDSEEVLLRHFQKFHDLMNEQMRQLGRPRRFHFSQCGYVLDYRMRHSAWYSPVGMYHRLRRFYYMPRRCLEAGISHWRIKLGRWRRQCLPG